MRSLLYRLFFGHVTIRPANWRDWRRPHEIDKGWELLYRARLNRNLFERGSLACRLTHDPSHIPEWMREPLPAILRRQAA